MSATYDAEKAKALFEQHIRPVVHGGGFGPIQYQESSRGHTHYVITPEMLRALRCHMCAYNQPHQLAGAIHSHLLDLDDGWYEKGWEAQIAPDPPKPAWRVAADKARDEGLEFSAVLDAIAAELEAK